MMLRFASTRRLRASLLEAGANLDKAYLNGVSPLHTAVVNAESEEPIQLLVQFGASTSHADVGGGGRTPGYWARKSGYSANL